MELRHLRYFVELAEQLHFGVAAGRLHIVQPALSMQIKALEVEVGTPLFRREKRKVTLTPAGEAFLPEARRALAQARHAVEVARQVAAGEVGRLRIGFSAGAVQSGIFVDVIRRFRATHPRVVIEPHEAHPRRQTEMLLADQLDASFGTAFDGVPDGLGAMLLARFVPQVVLPPDHPLCAQDCIAPQALRGQKFIGYAGPGDPDGVGMTARVLGYVPDIAFSVSTPGMAMGMVAAGLGLAIVPDSLAQGGGVFRPLEGVDCDLDVTLLWPLARAEGVTAQLLALLQRG